MTETEHGKKSISADIGILPDDPDPTSIGSVAKFLFISHLVRTPIMIDSKASIQGDLLNAWSVNRDQTRFSLTFKESEFFNDGSSITAEDFVRTIEFRKKSKTQIHFDFENIVKISAEKNVVKIELKKPSPMFITQLSQPEFGILHRKTILSPELGPLICSGFYCLETFDIQKVILTRNKFSQSTGPEKVVLISAGEKRYQSLKDRSLDFILEFGKVPESIEDLNSEIDVVKPHIGFTHWISINPRSKLMADVKMRRVIQALLKKAFEKVELGNSGYAGAEQLFLPGGPGRLTGDEIKKIWNKNAGDVETQSVSKLSGKTLTLLMSSKFEFQKDISNILKKISEDFKFKIVTKLYANQTELQALIDSGDFELLQINNDFSGFDLTLNVAVAFNQQRPLVILPNKSGAKNKIELLLKEPLQDKRASMLRDLSEEVLSEGLVVPLLYKQAFIVKRKTIDISAWSVLFPEVAFWKAIVN